MNATDRHGRMLRRLTANAAIFVALITTFGTSDAFANTAPTASFSASSTSGNAPLEVMFKGQSSKDKDGRIVDYHWDFGNGSSSGPVAKYTFSDPGTYIVSLTVTDNGGATGTAQKTITVHGDATTPTPPENSAPVISGSPSGSVTTGTAYGFQPSASDADGDPLAFSVQNKPAWASFDRTTGRLAGTPSSSDVGRYSNITIAVSDGTASASLPVFSIDVVDVANGGVTLNWTPPTQNTDGSALRDLAGYRIGYGTNSNNLTQIIDLMNPGLTSAVIENLASGTWFFAVKAINAAGIESDFSALASKSIP